MTYNVSSGTLNPTILQSITTSTYSTSLTPSFTKRSILTNYLCRFGDSTGVASRSGANRVDVQHFLDSASEGVVARGVDDWIQTQSDVRD